MTGTRVKQGEGWKQRDGTPVNEAWGEAWAGLNIATVCDFTPKLDLYGIFICIEVII